MGEGSGKPWVTCPPRPRGFLSKPNYSLQATAPSLRCLTPGKVWGGGIERSCRDLELLPSNRSPIGCCCYITVSGLCVALRELWQRERGRYIGEKRKCFLYHHFFTSACSFPLPMILLIVTVVHAKEENGFVCCSGRIKLDLKLEGLNVALV